MLVKKENTQKFSDHAYVESALGILLGNILGAVKKIKAKYSSREEDSVQRTHANDVMNFVEWALERVHQEILPGFDRGSLEPACPNIFLVGYYGLKINSNYSLFSTREWTLFERVIELIRKKLPDLIKKFRKSQPKKPLTELICLLLDDNKKSLYSDALKIPGENLDPLFSEMKSIIIALNLFNQALKVDLHKSSKEIEFDIEKKTDNDVVCLRNKLFGIGAKFEDGCFDFKHFHPMIFELAVEIAKFSHVLPRKLNPLIPFLDPKGVDHFATTLPLVGGLETLNIISHFSFKQVVAEGATEEDSDAHAHEKDPHTPGSQDVVHRYQLQVDGRKIDKDAEPVWQILGQINLNELFATYFGLSFSRLLGLLAQHQRSVPANKAVQSSMNILLNEARSHYESMASSEDLRSECARASLLQKCVALELERSKSYLAGIPDPVQGVEERTDLELIEALDRAIEREEKKAQKFEELLQKRNSLYDDELARYVYSNTDLTDQVPVDQAAGHDMSYLKAPLPDDIFGFGDQNTLEIIPIRSRLRRVIDEKIQELDYDEAVQRNLEAQRDQATTEWVNERIKTCFRAVHGLMGELDSKKTIVAAIVARQKKQVDSYDIQSLKLALQELSEEEKELETTLAFAKSVLENKKVELTQLPNRALMFSLLPQTLEQTVEPLGEKSIALVEIVNSALSRLRSEQKDLEGDLRKAAEIAKQKEEAEAEYARNMKDLRIESMEQQLRECSEKSAAFSEDRDTVTREREQTLVELQSRGCADLSFAQNESRNFSRQISELNITIRSLVTEAHGKIPEECRPDLESSFKDIQILIQPLGATIRNIDIRLENAHLCGESLEFLLQVKQIIAVNEKQIDIEKIVGLPTLAKKGKGLIGLITMLSFTEEQVEEWQKYCEDEQATFTPVFKQRRVERRNTLFAQLEKKISELDQIINVIVKADTALVEQLRKIERDLTGCQNKKVILEYQSAYQNKEVVLQRINEEDEKAKKMLNMLHPFIRILKGIESLNSEIEAFSKKDEKFYSKSHQLELLENLISRVSVFNKSIEALRAKLISLGKLIKAGGYDEIHESTFGNLEKLFQSMVPKLQESIKEKFSPLENEVRALNRNIKAFKTKASMFSDQLGLYTEAVELTAEHARLKGILTGVRKVIQFKEDAADYQTILKEIEDSFQSLPEKTQRQIERKFEATVISLSSTFQDFQAQYRDVKSLFTGQIFESSLCEEETVSQINAKFEKSQKCLVAIKKHYEFVRVINQNVQLLGDQKKSDQMFDLMLQLNTLNAELTSLNRSVMGAKMLRDLSIKLNQYLAERPGIDDARREYIDSLQGLLSGAAKNRKCAAVIEALKQGAGIFYGYSVSFEQLLNQMTVEILDFTRCGRYPHDESRPNHHAALTRSKEIGNAQTKRTFKKLYRNIDQMQDYAEKELPREHAEIVTELAAKLRMDVDRFVLQHQKGEQISSKDYRRFRDTFNARLHSQDLIIKQYKPLWSIVASIFIMVVSLGAQPLYSLYNGNSAFFYEDKVQIRKQIGVMENAVNKDYKFLTPQNPR